jgi:hypothetical protein
MQQPETGTTGPTSSERRAMPAALRALAGYVWFQAGIQVLALALSLMHVTIDRGLAASILLASAGLGVAGSRFAPAGEPSKSLAPQPPDGALRWLTSAFTAIAVAFFVLLAAVAYIKPDVSCDGNWYHLPTINYWALRGYVHWVQVDHMPAHISACVNGYPKGPETFAFVLSRALGDSDVLNTVNLCYLPAGILGVAALGSALGASRRVAWAAGLALVFIPVTICQSSTTYSDVSYAASVIALLAASSRCRPTADGAVAPLTRFITLGAAGGLALGAKATALVPVGLCGLWIVAAHIRRWAAGRAPAEQWRPVRAPLGVAVSCAALLAVGGYWYVRNWAYAGNPLYPVGIKLAGQAIFPGGTLADQIGQTANTPPRLRDWWNCRRIGYTWVQGWRRWPGSLLGYDSRLGGLGFLWILACVPAVIAATVRHARRPDPATARPGARATFWSLLVITALTFFLTPMNWWARYTLWIYGLGLPALASLIQRRRLRGLGTKIWLATCVTALLYEGAFAFGFIASARYPCPEMDAPPLQVIAATHEDVALAVNQECGLLTFGPLSLPLGARRVCFLAPEDLAPCGSPILADLERRGLRHVVWDWQTMVMPQDLRDALVSAEPAGGTLFLTVAKPDQPPNEPRWRASSSLPCEQSTTEMLVAVEPGMMQVRFPVEDPSPGDSVGMKTMLPLSPGCTYELELDVLDPLPKTETARCFEQRVYLAGELRWSRTAGTDAAPGWRNVRLACTPGDTKTELRVEIAVIAAPGDPKQPGPTAGIGVRGLTVRELAGGD